MPPVNRCTAVVIENDLIQAINTAIAKKDVTQTANDIRLLAVETLQYIDTSWSTQTQRYDGTQRAADEVVDKLHLAYTAANTLFRHRDLPDRLPGRIVACCTAHFQRKDIVTNANLEEILQGVSRAQMAQSKELEAEKAAIREAEMRDREEEAFGGAEGDHETSEVSTAAPQLQKTTTKGKESVIAGTTAASKIGDAAASEEAARTAQQGLGFAASTTPSNYKAGVEAAAAKTALQAGSGNFRKETGVKRYPDEDQWMKDLILANMKWAYKQYAEANTVHFKNTYYVDEDGKEDPGKRDGRTTNAVRLRFAPFRIDQAKKAAGGAVDDVEGDTPTKMQAGTPAGSSRKKGAVTATDGEVTDDGDDSSGGIPGNGSTWPAAVVIHASGKMLSREQAMADDADHVFAREMEWLANRSEAGDDEDPLRDLEETVGSVLTGDF